MSPAFDVPAIRNHSVERPRLLDELGTSDRRANLTIVHGAAGSGKSTLLAQWARQLELKNENLVWVNLNPDDAGLHPFWARIGTALVRNGIIQAGSELDQLTRFTIGALTAQPQVHETFHTLELPLTIVLDDYHLIENPEIDAQLRQLAQTAESLRLVVGTRSYGRLHSIDLAARVSTTIIDAGALAFTLEESKALVSASGLAEDSPLGQQIHSATLGWPLASHALLVEAQRDPINPSLRTTDVDQRPLFVQEIVRSTLGLRGQDADDLLLRVSLADECTVSLAAGLAERSEDWTMARLQEFERDGIGTWQVRSGVTWFRVHPLLLEAFRSEAEHRLDAETRQRLRALLSDELRSTRPLRALELAIEIADWNRFLEVFLLHYGQLSYYNLTAMAIALEGIPAEALDAFPSLLATKLTYDYGTPTATLEALNRMFTRVSTANRERLPVAHSVVGALEEVMWMGIHRLFGDMATALALAERAVEMLEGCPPADRHRETQAMPVFFVHIAITQLIGGHYHRALDSLERGRAIVADAGTLGDRFHLESVTALAYAVSGDIHLARDWIARSHANEPADLWIGGYLGAGYHIAKAISHLHNWDTTSALGALEALASREAVLEYWPYIAGIRANIDLIVDGPFIAHSNLDSMLARKRLRPRVAPAVYAQLLALKAELLLLSGQPLRAEKTLSTPGLPEVPEAILARARLALLRGEHSTAMMLADGVVWTSEENVGMQATALLTVAQIAYESAQPERAATAFVNAIVTMERHGLRLPLLTVPRDRLEALAALARAQGHASSELVLANAPALPSQAAPAISLSKAERRVLHALSLSSDVDTVAKALHLSTHTIRYHLKRSYPKLGVTSRAEAIARALELGMLGEAEAPAHLPSGDEAQNPA